jgi:hypothetical protein
MLGPSPSLLGDVYPSIINLCRRDLNALRSREAGPIEEGDLRNPTGESPAQVSSEDSDTCINHKFFGPSP